MLEARPASLSPEQPRQPAWCRKHPEGVRRLDCGDIVDAGTPGARPRVVPNPAFFDPKVPKAGMQPVSDPEAGYYDGLAKKGKKEIPARMPLSLIEEMDWRALAATLM